MGFPEPGASGRAAARGALLLAALVLWLPAAAQAQAPAEITLVSNTGQTQSQSQSIGNRDLAQGFRTGMTPDGYVLSALELSMQSDDATLSNLTVTLRDASGNDPDSILATFVNPDSPALSAVRQTFRFTLSEGEDLDPDTPYFIHLSNNHPSDGIEMALTVSDNQDSSGLADWGIDDTGRLFDHDFPNFGWFNSSLSTAAQIQLDGYAKVPTPVLITAEVDGDDLVLTYDGALDASSVPAAAAFTVTAGGAAVSVSTVSVSGMAVTLGLASAVTAGQTVLLDYVVPSSNPLQSGSGTAAGALAGQAVENRTLSAPSAPLAPTVSAVSGQSDRLSVSWMAPSDGGSAITDYDVRYCRGAATACTTDANFTEHAFTGTATATTIAMLMASSEHQVQVRATNAVGTGPRSASGAGTTAAVPAPIWSATMTVGESTSADRGYSDETGDSFGNLSGRDFTYNNFDYTVKLLTVAMSGLNLEFNSVPAGFDGFDDKFLEIAGHAVESLGLQGNEIIFGNEPSELANPGYLTTLMTGGRVLVCLRTASQTCPAASTVPSAPLAPSAPTVSAVSGQIDRLSVSWTAPSDGGSAITDYDVRYCGGAATACTTDANFTEHAFTGTATATAIAMLMAASEHQVQVRATNAEGTGPWSASGAGTTETPMLTARFVGDDKDVYIVEGDEVELTVRLSGAPGRQVAIPLGTRGRFGVSSADYTGVPSSLTFGATETERTFTVTAVDDSEIDLDERVIVEFGTPAPSGIVLPGSLAADPASRREILFVDNDFLYQASYQPSRSYSAGEASGALTVTVRLRTPLGLIPEDLLALNETVVVSVSSTDGTATAGEDYTALSGLSLSFAPTDFVEDNSPVLYYAMAEKTVTVSITDDAVQEGATPETFTLALSHDSGQRVEYVPSSGGETATVSITDDDADPPSAPSAPTVSAVSGQSDRLSVSWTAPSDGGSAITDYDVRYCQGAVAACTADTDFSEHAFIGTATAATITTLMAATEHQVQVRATNAEGTGPWSASGAGTTAAPQVPVWTSAVTIEDLGVPGGGGGYNNDATFMLNLPFMGTTLAVGGSLTDADFEYSGSTYTVKALFATTETVEFVVDRAGLPDTLTLEMANAEGTWTIAFSDKAVSSTSTRWIFEHTTIGAADLAGSFAADKVATVCLRQTVATNACPAARYVDSLSAPSAPAVSAVSGQSDRLSVSWTAPSGGNSAITDYDVRYCRGAASACMTDADFTEHAFTGTATAATIAMLMASSEYQVQVRATNGEGTGPWSAPGAGTTGAAQTDPEWTSAVAIGGLDGAAGQVNGYNSDATLIFNWRSGLNTTLAVGGSLTDGDFEYSGSAYTVKALVTTSREVVFEVDREGLPETLTLEMANAQGTWTIAFSGKGPNSTSTGWAFGEDLFGTFNPRGKFEIGKVATVCLRTATQTCPAASYTDAPPVPSAPSAPTVSAVSGQSDRLSVSWDGAVGRGLRDHGLRRAVLPRGGDSVRDGRRLHRARLHRDGDSDDDRDADGVDGTPGAGAGDQRRGRRAVVGVGGGDDGDADADGEIRRRAGHRVCGGGRRGGTDGAPERGAGAAGDDPVVDPGAARSVVVGLHGGAVVADLRGDGDGALVHRHGGGRLGD